jgi:hypothetical protein
VFAVIIGAIDNLIRLAHFVSFLWRKVSRWPQNLKHKYGTDPSGTVKDETLWAVVTGGSDGIGLAMAHEMASQGFGVCIMARNLTKINKCLEDIKKLHPQVKTKAVVCDFS